jgi:hypothetical protein
MIRRLFLSALTFLILLGASAGPLKAQGFGPKRPIGPAAPIPRRAADTITLQQAHRAYEAMAAQHDIAWGALDDGCYARAHLMVRRLQAMGFRPGKVWAFGAPNAPLSVRAPNGRLVRWEWHVAPVLKVALPDGRVVLVVIDPALCRAPATVDFWRQAMSPGGRAPYVHVAPVGVPPVKPDGTRSPSSYWMGPHPRWDLDALSVEIMRLYKPYEGRPIPPDLLQRYLASLR